MATYDVMARLTLDAGDLGLARIPGAKRILEASTPRPITWVGSLSYETRIRVDAENETQAVRRAEDLTGRRVADDSGLKVASIQILHVEVGEDGDGD